MFTINKPNIMKKSKYQQYFHCYFLIRFAQTKITLSIFVNNWVISESFLLVEPYSRVKPCSRVMSCNLV